MKDVVQSCGLTVDTLPDRDWVLQGSAYPTQSLLNPNPVYDRPFQRSIVCFLSS